MSHVSSLTGGRWVGKWSEMSRSRPSKKMERWLFTFTPGVFSIRVRKVLRTLWGSPFRPLFFLVSAQTGAITLADK